MDIELRPHAEEEPAEGTHCMRNRWRHSRATEAVFLEHRQKLLNLSKKNDRQASAFALVRAHMVDRDGNVRLQQCVQFTWGDLSVRGPFLAACAPDQPEDARQVSTDDPRRGRGVA